MDVTVVEPAPVSELSEVAVEPVGEGEWFVSGLVRQSPA
jgi:hypothetical protein